MPLRLPHPTDAQTSSLKTGRDGDSSTRTKQEAGQLARNNQANESSRRLDNEHTMMQLGM